MKQYTEPRCGSAPLFMLIGGVISAFLANMLIPWLVISFLFVMVGIFVSIYLSVRFDNR